MKGAKNRTRLRSKPSKWLQAALQLQTVTLAIFARLLVIIPATGAAASAVHGEPAVLAVWSVAGVPVVLSPPLLVLGVLLLTGVVFARADARVGLLADGGAAELRLVLVVRGCAAGDWGAAMSSSASRTDAGLFSPASGEWSASL